MTADLLKRMLEYIEWAEVRFDGEWGVCRSLNELIEQGKMPPLYTDVLDHLNDLSNVPLNTVTEPTKMPTALKATLEELQVQEAELLKQLEEVRSKISKLKADLLPRNFDRDHVLNFLKSPSSTDWLDWAFGWSDTPQGSDYWYKISHKVEEVTPEVINQLQKWVIQSFLESAT